MSFEDERLPLVGGPLHGVDQEMRAPTVEVPIEPCDDERTLCFGRYELTGPPDGPVYYEYRGHDRCGETVNERTARFIQWAFGDLEGGE